MRCKYYLNNSFNMAKKGYCDVVGHHHERLDASQ
jgi:hypothetical protein